MASCIHFVPLFQTYLSLLLLRFAIMIQNRLAVTATGFVIMFCLGVLFCYLHHNAWFVILLRTGGGIRKGLTTKGHSLSQQVARGGTPRALFHNTGQSSLPLCNHYSDWQVASITL